MTFLHEWVSIDDVVTTNVRESLNPDVETNAQLIEREARARRAYLDRQHQPKAQPMYLSESEAATKISKAEAQTPSVGDKTTAFANAADTNIDDLIQKIESLEIAAIQGLVGQDYNSAEAKYRGYRARLLAVNEKVAGMYPVSLTQLAPQVARVSQLQLDADMREDDIFYEINKLSGKIISDTNNVFQEMSELMKAHRGRYRELPQWKHLYARAIAKVPELEQLNLLRPMTASDAYRRPASSPAFPSGCHFCGKPGHMARRCRAAEDLVNSKQPLVKMGERWYAVTNPNDLTESVELKRDTSDGTMLTWFRKLTKAARDETKRELFAHMCDMGEDYTDYESSPSLVMEDPDPVVVGQNGEAYKGPIWRPKSKLTLNEYSVASIINLGSRRESDRDIIARVSKAMVLNGALEGVETVSSHPALREKSGVGFSPYSDARKTREKGKVSTPLLDATKRTGRSATPPLVAVKPDTPKVTSVLPHAPESFRPSQVRFVPAEDIEMKDAEKKTTIRKPEMEPKQLRLATSGSKTTAWRPPALVTPRTSLEKTEKKLVSTTQNTKEESKPSVDKKQRRPFVSNAAMNVDPEALFRRITFTPGGAPPTIGELIAVCDPYRRWIAQQVRGHRYTNTSAAAVSEDSGNESDEGETYESHNFEIMEEVDDGDFHIWRTEAVDHEYQVLEREDAITDHPVPLPIDEGRIQRSHGQIAHPNDRYLMVDTCRIIAEFNGMPVEVMIDDGSQINVMPEELYDELTRLPDSHNLGLRTETRFRVSGIHGKAEPLLGHVDIEIKIGGIKSRHVVWVGRNVNKVILGMPFIWLNRVDLFWSGERRVFRQHTARRQVSNQYMHLPGGPEKTLYDPVGGYRVKTIEPSFGSAEPSALAAYLSSCLDTFNLADLTSNVAAFVVNTTQDDPASEKAELAPANLAEDLGDKTFEADGGADDLKDKEESTRITDVWRSATAGESTLFVNSARLTQETQAHSFEDDVGVILAGSLPDLDEGEYHILHVDLSNDFPNEKTFLSAQTFLSAGAYKPVHKKKKPVETIYPEVEKPKMIVPEGINDAPTVSTQPIPRSQLQYGKRITKERLEPLLTGDFLTETEKDMFANILVEHEVALAWTEEEKGCFDARYIPPYKIPLIPHVPWQDKMIRMAAKSREDVIAFLKEKLKNGLYERSQSSYRSAFFAVQKKDGRIRLVHDLQKLNAVTIRDAGVPPNMDEMTESLACRAIYTGLDAFAGYDQLELHPDSRDVTSFESPMGTLRLTKMPQGWTNAVAAFHRVMEFIFADEKPEILQVYIDDVTIKGGKTRYQDETGQYMTLPEAPNIRKFVFEHACDVNKVLYKMKRYGGTFSGKKLALGVPEVTMVGCVCSLEGRLINKTGLEKLAKWETCRTKKDLRHVLGVLGVARTWIRRYGELVKPMNDLLKLTDSEFEWNEEAARALAAAKEAVMNCGVLRPIDYSRVDKYPPILAVDASNTACGLELAQMDEKGRRRPARYMSIYYDEVQQRYSQPKLELYGVFIAMKAARPWIHGCRFILEHDCISLKQMINSPSYPSATEGRWVWYILSNDFEMKHVPGNKHLAADAMSRRPRQIDDSTDDENNGEEFLDLRCGGVSIFSTHTSEEAEADSVDEESNDSPPPDDPIIPDDSVIFRRELYSDDWLAMGRFLSSLQWPAGLSNRRRKALERKVKNFVIIDGLLFRRRKDPKDMPVEVILDKSRRLRILHSLHEAGGHRGIKGTGLRLADRFWWEGMWKDIENHVRSCDECQRRDARVYEDPRRSQKIPTVFMRWDIDCVAMGRPSNKDNTSPGCMVVCRDNLTGWVEARALRTPNSADIAEFFVQDVLVRFGVMAQVTADNGTEFLSHFKDKLIRYGIPRVNTSAYNPAANGMVERGHAQLKEAIFRRCRHSVAEWSNYLPYALWADRTTVRRSTGQTPYFMVYGQECVLPIDTSEKTLMISNWEKVTDTVDLLEARMRQLELRDTDLKIASKRVEASRALSIEYINEKRFRRHRDDQELKPGELVLIREARFDTTHKAKSYDRYRGPYRIVRKSDGGAYVLSELNGVELRKRIGHNLLRRYYPRESLEAVMLSELDEANDRGADGPATRPVVLAEEVPPSMENHAEASIPEQPEPETTAPVHATHSETTVSNDGVPGPWVVAGPLSDHRRGIVIRRQ